jgi:hypothetical protein
MATDWPGIPQFTAIFILVETVSMKLSALAARCAHVTPGKLHIALPLLIMALLYWLSSLPGTPLPDDTSLHRLFLWLPSSVQDAFHVPAYAVLSCASWWALGAWLRVPGARALSACAIASAYGVFDEWHQSFVPGRYASLTDITLDVAGAVLGALLAASLGSIASAINSRTNKDATIPRT